MAFIQPPLSFMLPKCDWTPTPVNQLPSWAGAKRVAVDIETHDPKLKELGPGVRRGGYICGISFAIEDGPAHYLPVRHAEGNLDQELVFRYLRDQCEVFKGIIVGANIQYDLDYLWEQKIPMGVGNKIRDVQIAEPLIDELEFSYSLDNIAARRGIPGKYKDVLDAACAAYGKKTSMVHIPAKYVGEYAEQDVRLPLALMRRQEKDIDDQNLWQIFDLESRLTPVLVKMRRRGVLVDLDRLDQVEKWTHEQQALAVVEANRGKAQIHVSEVNEAEAVAQFLIKSGISESFIPKTPKTNKFSIKNEFLMGIKTPEAAAIVRARKMSKIRTTFVESVRKHQVNGRIHTTFNQLRMTSDSAIGDTGDDSGARYGRLSSTDPNLQQQPGAKDPEIGKIWRSIYIPEHGMKWAALDYSQQEPRMIVHYADLCGCEKANEAAERYRNDPNTDNHTLMAQLIAGQPATWKPSKKERTEAKIIFLGLAYSMGGGKLARSLGLPTCWKESSDGSSYEAAGPEAQIILDNFHNGVPFIKELNKLITKRINEKGFIRTVLGRVCHFKMIPMEKRRNKWDIYEESRKGLNKLAQGSSADQTKKAVLDCDDAGHELQLQVHDELDLSVWDYDHAKKVATIMENCVPLRVPSKVDIEIAANWGDSL
jgi:DNA polymerase I-like protein with 3'-5' exonuclease and polymerase domains